ncbi:MAG: PorP/SprF family type IX secretion system membrane protein, partial [Bacteroidia bacterium]
LLISGITFAQDLTLTQFQNSPTYLNPAFTGNKSLHRVSLGYRNQWPGLKKSFTSYLLTYDYSLSRYKSGIGLIAMQDKAGASKLTNTKIGLNYSYVLPLDGGMTLRMGLQACFNQKKNDLQSLVFSDQIITGSTSLDVLNHANGSVNYFDVGTGLLLESNDFWFSVSALHLNQPKNNWWGTEDVLQMLISSTGGYHYSIAKDEATQKPSHRVSASYHYRHQGVNDQLDLGVSHFYKFIDFGIWYRGVPFKTFNSSLTGSESIAFVLAYEPLKGGYRIGYSFDLTISNLGLSSTNGTHEIGLSYEIGSKKPAKRRARNTIGGGTEGPVKL